MTDWLVLAASMPISTSDLRMPIVMPPFALDSDAGLRRVGTLHAALQATPR
jgi:hypothetical protein